MPPPADPAASGLDPAVVEKTAQRTLDSYRKLFADAYAYGAIDRAAYDPEIFAWYDEVTGVLAGCGYTAVGDMKIVKDAAVPEPGAGPFTRRFVAADGLAWADIFQMKDAKGGWVRVLNFVSEFDDGRFVWTTTAPTRWNTPDHKLLEAHPADAPVAALAATHAARRAAWAAAHPGVDGIAVTTLQSLLASEARGQAATGAFRRRQAVPSVDELKRLGSTPALAEAVHAAMRRIAGLAPAASAPAAVWQVVRADLPTGAGVPTTLDALIGFALDQGLQQVREAGSPLNPFLVVDGGRAYFFIRGDGSADADPMEVALQTLRTDAAGARRCALVLDSRIGLKDGTQADAILAMAAERGAAEGVTWAQAYRPKGWLKPFKVLDFREPVATSKNLFAEAAH